MRVRVCVPGLGNSKPSENMRSEETCRKRGSKLRGCFGKSRPGAAGAGCGRRGGRGSGSARRAGLAEATPCRAWRAAVVILAIMGVRWEPREGPERGIT